MRSVPSPTPEATTDPQALQEAAQASEPAAHPEPLEAPAIRQTLTAAEFFQHIKSRLPHSPQNRRAEKLLPEIFSKSEREQSQIFEETGKIISELEKDQQKISSHRWFFDGKPICPLYCFRGPSGKLRYFFSPKTHQINQRRRRKRVGILGKGSQGIVVPGYELKQDKDGRWGLSKDAQPTIAIKISKKTDPLNLENENKRIEKEIALAKKFYGDEVTVFSKLFKRSLHKVTWGAPDWEEALDYHKIYTAMEYLPGENGQYFCEIYKLALRFEKEALQEENQKNIFLLSLFLEASDYCISLIDQVIQAHDRGILLRDIKPANLILNEGKARLIDFGLSESIDNTKDLHRCGTSLFVAPETLEEKPKFSKSSDTFSTVMSIAYLLGLYEEQYSQERMFESSQQIPEPSKVSSERKDTNDETLDKGKSEAQAVQKRRQVNPVIKMLAENSPARITESLLANIPIASYIKESILKTMKKAVNPDPDERPDLAVIKNVLETAQKDALKRLEQLAPQVKTHRKERKTRQKQKALEKKASLEEEKRITVEEYKAQIGDFYQYIYRKANARELEAVNNDKNAQKCDRLNFLAWLVSQNTFQEKFANENKILLFFCKHFELASEIPLTDNLEANIEAISTKANEMNHRTQIMTRWQFHRIYENYEMEKDRSFLGLRWFTQSAESAKAIQKANEAKTPEARHKALISDYIDKKPRSSFLFFPRPKENSKRTLGRSIMQFRAKA